MSLAQRRARNRIAIVGRPNVGKSTLFNRLVRHRRAITDPTPGVTRDPIALEHEFAEREITMVDTGGYTTETDDLALVITEKALAEVERASVVLLLVDGTEITALDEELVEKLRGAADRTVLCVNKIDSPERQSLLYDAYRLGLERVIGISAAHGRGMDELTDEVDKLLSAREREKGEVSDDEGDSVNESSGLRLAILGQPNTGKSTLVNHLVGKEASIVSPIPGTTRDVIEERFVWRNQEFVILDTAGIRRKSRVHENIEYYSVNRAIGTIENAEVVALLVDAEKGLSDQDKKIAQRIVDRGRGVVIVLNKWDLLPKVGNQYQAISDRIRFVFPVLRFAPIIPISATLGDGIDKFLTAVLQVRAQLYKRVETGVLNRHVQKWVEETPPPVRGGRRLKVRYMTQVNTLPVTFVVFVSRKKGFPDSYVQYLKNRIAADFGIDSIPFRLELRERDR